MRSIERPESLISIAGILRIIHQLPADDGVVLTAIFDFHILKPAGDNFILERFRRENSETVRISGQIDVVRAVVRPVIVLEHIVVGAVNHEITGIVIAEGVVAFRAPTRGSELGGGRPATRQGEIKLGDFAENQSDIVSVQFILLDFPFLSHTQMPKKALLTSFSSISTCSPLMATMP